MHHYGVSRFFLWNASFYAPYDESKNECYTQYIKIICSTFSVQHLHRCWHTLFAIASNSFVIDETFFFWFKMSWNMAKNVSNHELQIIINLYSVCHTLTFKSIHCITSIPANGNKNKTLYRHVKSRRRMRIFGWWWEEEPSIRIKSSSSVQIECNLVCKTYIFHNDEMETMESCIQCSFNRPRQSAHHE